MTEAEWLSCHYPTPILEYLQRKRNKTSKRKLRLFACACCRRAWTDFPDVARTAVELSERYADAKYTGEQITVGHLKAAECSIEHARELMRTEPRPDLVGISACNAAANTLGQLNTTGAWHWSMQTVEQSRGGFRDPQAKKAAQAELHAQARMLRDLFGNPFRPVTFSLSCRTDIAQTLASQMYESRDFSAMPILADALQDAGCDSADIFDYCRSPYPHVRGCWVVDLVLAKG